MTEVYEIIEAEEGGFVLRRVDSDDEPVVTIQFSGEARKFLGEASGEIAKTMIEAGIHEVEDMMAQEMEDSSDFDGQSEESKPLIH